MAATKNTPKSAPAKKAAKPAAKSAKPAAQPVKKAVKKAEPPKKATPVKKAAPAKKQAPVKKAPAPAKKPTAVSKKVSAPVKKAPEKKVAAKPESRAKAAPAAKESKPAPKAVEKKTSKPAATVAPAPKAPAKKSGSSLVKTPVAPAPVKPPFVPPKALIEPSGPILAPGSNGSHSPAFVQKQRQRLLDLRDDLVDSMSGMTRDTIRNAPEGSEASGSGQHQGDAGSDAYDRDFALSVLAKEQDALYEIEQALRRIQAGNYGICEISSRKIPQARLEAIPFARLTVECQAQWEKEYGKRRFRPSNEVGFSGGNYIEDEDSESVSLDEDED
jgi:DnaK suppressor protein